MDIRNIKTKNIVCTSWSKIYKDLLGEIGIEADIINTFRHRGVNFKIDNYDIYADATIDKYMDLSRVKHNVPVNRFYTKEAAITVVRFFRCHPGTGGCRENPKSRRESGAAG